MSGSRSISQTRKGHSPDRETNRDRQALSALEGLLSRFAPLNGKFTAAVTVPATGSLAIPHKLGRRPTGWIVVDMQGGASGLFRDTWDDKTITIENPSATNATDLKLWVF